MGRKLRGQGSNAGVARSKAAAKRKRTLGVELESKDKVNKFADRRLGEGVPGLSKEEKALARFQRQQARHKLGRKKSKFNIDDDAGGFDDDFQSGSAGAPTVKLTHGGRALEEALADALSGSDSEAEETLGMMSRNYVQSLHFGGGDGKDIPKTHKEIMEEVIAKSKAFKEERKREKAALEEEREKLDDEVDFVEQMMRLQAKPQKPSREERRREGDEMASSAKEDLKKADFDSIVESLRRESKRARATDRTKTAEELAEEHAIKLAALEKERLRRMADDEESEEDEATAVTGKGFASEFDSLKAFMASADGSGVTDPKLAQKQEPQTKGKGKGKGKGKETDKGKGKGKGRSKSAAVATDDEEENDEDESGLEAESGGEDSASDSEGVKSGIVDTDSDDEYNAAGAGAGVGGGDDDDDDDEGAFSDFDIPDDDETDRRYRRLVDTVRSWRPSRHDPAEKLEEYFQAVMDVTRDRPMNCGAAWRHLLGRIRKRVAKRSARHAAVEAAGRDEGLQDGGFDAWPTGGELLALKLCLNAFPATDYRHNVLSPMMVLFSQCLTQSPVENLRDVARGLGVVALCFDAVRQSKKVVPEAFAFLHGVFALAASPSSASSSKHGPVSSRSTTHGPPCCASVPLPAFTSPSPACARALEKLHASFRKYAISGAPSGTAALDGKGKGKGKAKGKAKGKGTEKDAESSLDATADRLPLLPFRLMDVSVTSDAHAPRPEDYIAVLSTAYRLLGAGIAPLRQCEALPQLLEPLFAALRRIDHRSFAPSSPLRLVHMDTQLFVQSCINDVVSKRRHLQLQEAMRRLKPIRELEPEFSMGFNPERAETTKDAIRRMQRRVKRETKGAARELKRDAEYISRVETQKKQERDAERDAKYKEVMTMLQQQQATFNDMVKQGVVRGGGARAAKASVRAKGKRV